ncbi:MAG: hypothetical protein ACR2KG_08680 [Nocardioidaceae bacterium]
MTAVVLYVISYAVLAVIAGFGLVIAAGLLLDRGHKKGRQR